MISEHLQRCNCWGFGCPCVAESVFLCLMALAGTVPVLPQWRHRVCSAVWRWSRDQTLHRSLIAQDLHCTGGQGASPFDAMMPVFVKCYRQPFSKPVPLVHAYFNIIQCSVLFGGDRFKTDKKMLLNFLPVRCTLPGMTDGLTDLQSHCSRTWGFCPWACWPPATLGLTT